MARDREGDVIKSALIIAEVQKRPILYDTNHQAYGERSTKSQCWEEVCAAVMPNWYSMTAIEKSASGKEIQKRWRSIRDSYTKQYRAGKCAPPGVLTSISGGGKRVQHQRQMTFLYNLLEKKAPRASTEKRNSETDPAVNQNNPLTTVKQENEEPKTNSKHSKLSAVKEDVGHEPKSILIDKNAQNKPLSKMKPVKLPDVDITEKKNAESKRNDTKHNKADHSPKCQKKETETSEKEKSVITKKDDKETQSELNNSREDEVSLSYLRNSKANKEQNQSVVHNTHTNKDVFIEPHFRNTNVNVETLRTNENNNMNPSLEINIGTNTVLPQDHFDDDKLFMNSLLPFLRKMDDDTRLSCRIEMLKIIQRALQAQTPQTIKMPEEVVVKEEAKESSEERDLSKNASKSSQTNDLIVCRKRKPEDATETVEQPARRRGRPRKTHSAMELMSADWLVYDPEEASRKREERARRRLLRMNQEDPKPEESDCSERASLWRRSGHRDERRARAQRARAREETRARDDDDEELSRATSVTQLRAENFFKMYNLEPAKKPPLFINVVTS